MEIEECNVPYIPIYYRRNEWRQFLGVPIAKEVCASNPVSNGFTLKLPLQLALNTGRHITVLL